MWQGSYSLFCTISQVFSGVLLNLGSVGKWLSWVKYISIFRYAIEVSSPGLPLIPRQQQRQQQQQQPKKTNGKLVTSWECKVSGRDRWLRSAYTVEFKTQSGTLVLSFDAEGEGALAWRDKAQRYKVKRRVRYLVSDIRNNILILLWFNTTSFVIRNFQHVYLSVFEKPPLRSQFGSCFHTHFVTDRRMACTVLNVDWISLT